MRSSKTLALAGALLFAAAWTVGAELTLVSAVDRTAVTSGSLRAVARAADASTDDSSNPAGGDAGVQRGLADHVWKIDYKNATMVLEDGSEDEVTLTFVKSTNRTAEVTVYEINDGGGCDTTAAVPDSIVNVTSTEVLDNGVTEEDYLDLFKVGINIDKAAISQSSLWTEGASSSVGNITMCVRVDLKTDDSPAIFVSFREVEIAMQVDLSTNIFSLIGDVQADAVNTTEDEVATDYSVSIYQCRIECNDTGDELITQNSNLELCLKPSSEDVVISNFDLSMYQDGTDTYQIVDNNMNPNGLTTLSNCTEGYKIATFMISRFFEDDSNNVTINGTASLEFATTTRGRRRLDVDIGRSLQELGETGFSKTIGLAPQESDANQEEDAPEVGDGTYEGGDVEAADSAGSRAVVAVAGLFGSVLAFAASHF